MRISDWSSDVCSSDLGMMSAVYLTQYAAPTVRKWVKPMLEILAGVPTVVYGYFAALTVAPALRNFAVAIGIPNASTESALAAGVVMGVMIIPFVSSMADDSINAVPQRSEEHTSELPSLMRISYAVFCLKKHKH